MAARLLELLCWRSQRRFLRSDSVSSVESMFRLVVRGERAGWCVLEVVMIMGRGCEDSEASWAC